MNEKTQKSVKQIADEIQKRQERLDKYLKPIEKNIEYIMYKIEAASPKSRFAWLRTTLQAHLLEATEAFMNDDGVLDKGEISRLHDISKKIYDAMCIVNYDDGSSTDTLYRKKADTVKGFDAFENLQEISEFLYQHADNKGRIHGSMLRFYMDSWRNNHTVSFKHMYDSFIAEDPRNIYWKGVLREKVLHAIEASGQGNKIINFGLLDKSNGCLDKRGDFVLTTKSTAKDMDMDVHVYRYTNNAENGYAVDRTLYADHYWSIAKDDIDGMKNLDKVVVTILPVKNNTSRGLQVSDSWADNGIYYDADGKNTHVIQTITKSYPMPGFQFKIPKLTSEEIANGQNIFKTAYRVDFYKNTGWVFDSYAKSKEHSYEKKVRFIVHGLSLNKQTGALTITGEPRLLSPSANTHEKPVFKINRDVFLGIGK